MLPDITIRPLRAAAPVFAAVLCGALPAHAQECARRSGKALLTVRGGSPGRDRACRAYTAHGFVGVEREAVLAMGQCMKTGGVPAGIGR